VRLWEIGGLAGAVGRCMRVMQARACVDGLAWSPGGASLAMALFAVGSEVWDVATGVCKRVLNQSFFGARCVAWSPCGRLVVTGCFGSMYVHDLHNF
jgi:WD40 repeat protein